MSQKIKPSTYLHIVGILPAVKAQQNVGEVQDVRGSAGLAMACIRAGLGPVASSLPFAHKDVEAKLKQMAEYAGVDWVEL